MKMHLGDDGMTQHLRLGRISKASPEVDALGELDELNACIGWTISQLSEAYADCKPVLVDVQKTLFVLGGVCCGARQTGVCEQLQASLVEIEHVIEAWECELPPLCEFIVPGGSPGACAAHLARAVCRRAERAWTRVDTTTRGRCAEGRAVSAYLNRLSTFLFVLARRVNAVCS